ncbi:MAG: GGDEF domain-containing protein [Lachnospiraceae bacterium]|nr:GGDEF domain-containing protein [Lachnospiraceae bacterium]
MSENPTKNKSSDNETKKLRIQIIAGFAILIPVILSLVLILFNARMGKTLKEHTANMIHDLNRQIMVNMDGSMAVMMANASMITSDETVASYDPVSGEADSDIEAEIAETLNKYALFPEYLDFCVVYSDGSHIGMISDDLVKACGDRLYPILEKALNKTGGWTSELVSGRTSMTYLARANDSAIVVASLPSYCLVRDISDSMFMEGMNAYVADRSLVIIASTDETVTPGSYLKTDISRLVDRVNSNPQIGKNYVVDAQKMNNEWFLVITVPTDELLNPIKSVTRYALIIALVAALIAFAYVMFMTEKIVGNVSQTVNRLDVKAQTDLLTGLINKRSFEEIVDMTLGNPDDHSSYALIFMDIDNFKSVNDRCGHDVGDLVLKSFSHTIDMVFRETDIKGRLGGDEFCVLMKMTEEDHGLLVEHVEEVCRRFIDRLHRKANSARQSLPAVTSSMGAAIWEGDSEGFEELYHKADTALYASKKRGKDTWTIYGQNELEKPKSGGEE